MSSVTSVESPALASLGNVPADYVHQDRWVKPRAILAVPGGLLKWYEVGRPNVAISDELVAGARDFLTNEVESGPLDLGYGLGFVVLHDCAGVTFLIVGVWRNENELWKVVSERDPRDPVDAFHLGSYDEPVKPMLCVWEMTPVWHERNAWSRFLFSARDEPAKQAYLEDKISGIA